jgi:ubiquinone biosynthesis monooxygenase Coq7
MIRTNVRIITGMPEQIGWPDLLISIADEGLRTVVGKCAAGRPSPAGAITERPLSAAEREISGALMRVNRAGEISAQALYLGQALFARTAATRHQLLETAAEERDHLVWCSERLAELGGRESLLDPLWYAGSAAVGLLAGAAGDRWSLGFVSETERQVEAHLDDHLARLPENDLKSRAILQQMAADEAHHKTTAQLAGGREPPEPVRRMMAWGGGLLRRAALVV